MRTLSEGDEISRLDSDHKRHPKVKFPCTTRLGKLFRTPVQRTPLAANRVQKTELNLSSERSFKCWSGTKTRWLQPCEIEQVAGTRTENPPSDRVLPTLQRPGQFLEKEALTPRQRRHLFSYCAKPIQSFFSKTFGKKTGFRCSIRSVERALKEYGITKSLTKKIPFTNFWGSCPSNIGGERAWKLDFWAMGEDNPVRRMFDGKRDRETTTMVLSYTEWKVVKRDDTAS